MKTIANLIVVGLMLTFAPAFAQATEDPNPCTGDKKICVKVPGLSEDCFRVCCGESNPVVEIVDETSGETTVTKDCTCPANGFCIRVKGKRICLDAVQLEAYKAHKAKRRASAHRAKKRVELKALQADSAELAKFKGDAEAALKAGLENIKSQGILLESTEGWGRDVLAKATKVLDEANMKGADAAMLKKWHNLREAITAFETYLDNDLTTAKSRAGTLLANPDLATLTVVRSSLTQLQDTDLTLSNLTSALIATRDLVYVEEETDLRAELEAEKKKLVEKNSPRNNEISVTGAIVMTALDDQKGNLEDPTVAWVKLMYRRHFLAKSPVRPFVGGGIGSGNLPDTKPFISVIAEAGLRFGDPTWAFFWQARGAFNVIAGLLTKSGVQPSLNVGTGPGLLIQNKGFILLEGDYTLNQPSFYGTEWNSVGLALSVGTTF